MFITAYISKWCEAYILGIMNSFFFSMHNQTHLKRILVFSQLGGIVNPVSLLQSFVTIPFTSVTDSVLQIYSNVSTPLVSVLLIFKE